MINSKDILCVIVLYKSIYNECKTYRTFIQKNKDINVYICDNSPCRQNCEDYTVVKYDHSSFNLGLSKSYNKACDYAKINNYNWILLLDQDTDFSNVSIKDYIAKIDLLPYNSFNIVASVNVKSLTDNSYVFRMGSFPYGVYYIKFYLTDGSVYTRTITKN